MTDKAYLIDKIAKLQAENNMLRKMQPVELKGDAITAFTLAALREQAEREKGCKACGLIYAIHAESYGIEDLDCANEPIDNKFCPVCGKRLEVEHGE